MRKTLTMAAAVVALATAWSASAQDRPEVALVLGTKGSPFYEALQCGAQAKAEELGLDLTVSAPDQFAADSQIPVVTAVTAAAPAVAAIVPTDMQALIRPMRELHDRGTKVITVDQTIGDTSFVATQVLTDNHEGGRLAAQAMATLLPEGGKVLVITQPPGSMAQDARVTGFEEELQKLEGFDYLGAQYQANDPAKTIQIVTSTLSAHPDLAGIFATNDQGAIGTVTGLRQAGVVGEVKVVAYDAATAEVEALKNGGLHALIAQNPKLEGEVAMEMAARLIAGEELDKVTMTEIVTILSDQIELAEQYEYKADCM